MKRIERTFLEVACIAMALFASTPADGAAAASISTQVFKPVDIAFSAPLPAGENPYAISFSARLPGPEGRGRAHGRE